MRSDAVVDAEGGEAGGGQGRGGWGKAVTAAAGRRWWLPERLRSPNAEEFVSGCVFVSGGGLWF